MKRLVRIIIVVGATLLLFAAFVLIFNMRLENQLNSLYSDNLASVYGATVKDQGIAIQERGIDANHFMLFGSSELGSDVPENPLKFFPTKDTSYYIDCVGRGHSQSLMHTIDIGALGSKLKNKKIGIVVSLQWFYNKEGTTSDEFAMNFSEEQFYKYMDNNNISKEQKEYVAGRVYEILKSSNIYILPAFYAQLYLGKNLLTEVGYYAFKPYYFLRENLLYSKDLTQSIKFIKERKLNVSSKPQLKSVNWLEETKKAENLGKKDSTNNIYYIDNLYYAKNIKPYMNKMKNSEKNINLKDSKEYNDLEELLKTVKSAGAKPYIIIMPVNGTFYDYLGLTKDERSNYYDKVEAVAQENKVESLKMTGKDYEPYFMRDIEHLGWKGWLYVDQKISQYISSN